MNGKHLLIKKLQGYLQKYQTGTPFGTQKMKSPVKYFFTGLLPILIVVSPGFEPRRTVPKTVVLPLHHETIRIAFTRKAVQRYGFFYKSTNAKPPILFHY